MVGILLNNPIFLGTLIILARTWSIWLPVALFLIFKSTWVGYVRAAFMAKQKWVLLEVKIPREQAKSPKAMESILAGIHGTNRGGNMKERYWDGWLTAWFSLEIVGDATGVHFYVRTQDFFRRMIESQIYAQYPSCEIKLVEDYTKETPPAMPSKDWTMWGSEFLLTKPDAYPIRTYEDFDLVGISTKEEATKIDPLSSLIEFFGTFRGSERMWLQMIVRPASEQWIKDGQAIVDKIGGKSTGEYKPLLGKAVDAIGEVIGAIGGGSAPEKVQKKEKPQGGFLSLSPGMVQSLKALELNMQKIGFEVGIRWMYLAKNEDYNALAIPALNGIFKQYASPNLNGFKLNGEVSTSVDYVFKKTRETSRKRRLYNAYRWRSFFHPPYRGKTMILSSSELATVYHFPGMVVAAPSMERIEAKRGAAPPNLPI